MRQEQFLHLLSAEEAAQRFREAVRPRPSGEEHIPLLNALRRVLSRDVVAYHNVPFFDRSNFDGFAVQAKDTFGAEENVPISLRLNPEVLHCGVLPHELVSSGTATPISTGGMLPRGADSVVMLEHTHLQEGHLQVLRPVTPGSGVSFAGSDIGAGERVLACGDLLGHRETGTLAALGEAEVWVWRRPRVGILSTGDELIAPGEPMRPGKVHDCNSTLLSHAVEELGASPEILGILPDDEQRIEQAIRNVLGQVDLLLLSAGTSKGEGDQNYRVFRQFGNPGVLVHGVALKPGKPLCLAVLEGTPAAILPGFPTSAIFTFTRFIAPVLRSMAGLPPEVPSTCTATLPMPLNSEKGRTEFHMVHLVSQNSDAPNPETSPAVLDLTAYSTGKGSGSITGFARADGFVEVPREVERVEAGQAVRVHLLGDTVRVPELMVVGSHCVGLDFLLGRVREEFGVQSRSLSVGSMGGVLAARRGECDLAGTHLMAPETGLYNEHLVTSGLQLVKGYRRRQGLVFLPDCPAFLGIEEHPELVILNALRNPELRMIHRNRGSGTRVLLDQLLGEQRPPGFLTEAKSHNAVAAAVAQGRADWGVAIESVAHSEGLGFHFLQDEEYDFLVPEARLQREAVQQFLELLSLADVQQSLRNLGLEPSIP
ncbi:MAG: molybdopterin biosynthesis protein [bacterium]|jgi:putative molybdopterin biosynthesis protein